MDQDEQARRVRRLQLARQAYKDFYGQCFWSYRRDLDISEVDIPFVIRELRANGGHSGYRRVRRLIVDHRSARDLIRLGSAILRERRCLHR